MSAVVPKTFLGPTQFKRSPVFDGLSTEEFNRCYKNAKNYTDRGYTFPGQWMLDYLCSQILLDEHNKANPTKPVCHDCGEESLDIDALFQCSRASCKRYTHHGFDCSKSMTKEDYDVPAVQEIEAMWVCWECMFKKTLEVSRQHERKLAKALQEYEKGDQAVKGKRNHHAPRPSRKSQRSSAGTTGGTAATAIPNAAALMAVLAMGVQATGT